MYHCSLRIVPYRGSNRRQALNDGNVDGSRLNRAATLDLRAEVLFCEEDRDLWVGGGDRENSDGRMDCTVDMGAGTAVGSLTHLLMSSMYAQPDAASQQKGRPEDTGANVMDWNMAEMTHLLATIASCTQQQGGERPPLFAPPCPCNCKTMLPYATCHHK
jgi:hypothetical protein